jgi:hypothetical protein
MSFSSWLHNWRRFLERRSALEQTRRRRPAARRLAHRLRLEALEDRTVLSPLLTATNLAVSGSNGAVVSNSGSVSDTTAGASVTLTASAGTVVQNSNGTWSWSQTTPAGAAQTAPVTIYATDSNGQTVATEFWLNVGKVFTVTNTLNDGSAGSLLWAINQVNNDTSDSAAQPDLIAFDITAANDAAAGGTGYNPSTGVATILGGAAPRITMPVVIDGYTQPGTGPNTLLGVQLPAPGSPPTTQPQGDNAVLKVQVDLSNAGSNAWGLDLSANNSTVRGLVLNGIEVDSPAILVEGTGDHVEGNFIGTDVTGTQVAGNASFGIQIAGSNAVVGGTTPDARNIISGNGNSSSVLYLDEGGIRDRGTGDTVQGNFIGTDVSGKIALGNGGQGVTGGGSGVAVYGNNATIGGTAPGAGNLISGNQSGIGAGGSGVIEGNLIGTDVSGTSALGNSEGIRAGNPMTIGGNSITNPAARNVISGNGTGIDDQSSSSLTLIEGNYIGTDITGTKSISNGSGVWLNGGDTLGGTDPGDGNVISGNQSYGVRLFGNNNAVQGNLIGTDYTGTKAIANGNGIWAQDSGNNNVIGGTSPGAGNVIAFSSNGGITVLNGAGNSILGNSIHDNHSYSIGLANGANDNQSAPVLTSASSSSSGTTISGTLTSVANTTFRIEFFSSPGLDGSGNGEGQTYLGSTTVTTDRNGNASFTASGLQAVPAGQGYLTATATVATPNGSGGYTYGDSSAFSHYGVLANTALTSSAASSVYGQQVTFTATLSPSASGLGTPTGSVDFVDTSTNTDLGRVALSNGSASLTTSALTAGSHVIKAIYSGDSTFLAGNNTLTQAVAQAQPVFSLTAPPTAISGTSTTQISGSLTAGTLVPTGSVTVTVNGVSQSAAINPDGSFSVVMQNSALGAGSYTINYSYVDTQDNNFASASASATMNVTNGVLALFNQGKSKHAGSTIPVQIELVNASGQDLTSGATITAVGMAATTDTTDTVGSIDPSKVGTLQSVQSAGNANPGNVFRIQGGSDPFAMYNLQTPTTLSAGTYRLYFSVSNDPLLHWVTFTIS